MTALVLGDSGLELVQDYPVPVPPTGAALIQTILAGICSTDLQLLAGYKGGFRGVLGHEFVGRVVSAPGSEEWIGRRVVGEINIGCGDCHLCAIGMNKHCTRRTCMGIVDHDGTFAEYICLPVQNLHIVPSAVNDTQAVFTEPLAAALEILEQLFIRPTTTVYVIGDGRLGLLIAQILATTNCNLTVIGRHRAKLDILARRGIVTVLSNEQSLQLLAESGADVVVEATGQESGFFTARQLVRPKGTMVIKSTFAGALTQFDLSSLVVDEITLLGSRCGPFAPALRLLARQEIDIDSLVSASYPLANATAAFDHAARRGVLKVLLLTATAH